MCNKLDKMNSKDENEWSDDEWFDDAAWDIILNIERNQLKLEIEVGYRIFFLSQPNYFI